MAMLASSAIIGSSASAEALKFSGSCSENMDVNTSRDAELREIAEMAKNGVNTLPAFEDICELNGKKVLRVMSFRNNYGFPVGSITYQEVPTDYVTLAMIAGTVTAMIVSGVIIFWRHRVNVRKNARLAREEAQLEALTGQSRARAAQVAREAGVPTHVNLADLGIPGHSGNAKVSGAINFESVNHKAKATMYTDKKNGDRYTTVYDDAHRSHVVFVYPYGSNFDPFFYDPFLGQYWRAGTGYHPVFVDTSRGDSVVNPNIPNQSPAFPVGPQTDAPYIANERPMEPNETIVGQDLNTNPGSSTGAVYHVVPDGQPAATEVFPVDNMAGVKADNTLEVAPTDNQPAAVETPAPAETSAPADTSVSQPDPPAASPDN
jgi:hypothetical protein